MSISKIQTIKIDRRSSLSIDLQLINALKTMILDHIFTFQDMLPEQRETAKLLNIDIIDVQTAYQSLLTENYLTQSHGHFFVNRFELTSQFSNNSIKIYDVIKLLGLTPSIEIITHKKLSVDLKLSEKSGFIIGTHVLYQRRIYYGNQTPLFVLDLYLPLKFFTPIDDLLNNSIPLYDLMANNYNQKITASNRIYSVVNLEKDLSSIFKIKSHSAGYLVTAKSYNLDQEQIEYTEGYSSNNYSFELILDFQTVKKSYPSIY